MAWHIKGLLTATTRGAMVLPRCLVFDLDGCCWDPEMYELWGGGAPFKDNKDGSLSDKQGTKIRLLGDVAAILQELTTQPKWKDSIVAIASTCDEPKWARECLQKFPLGPKLKMIEVFHPDCMEIYKASGKDKHINTIAQKTGIDVKDMIFFDNQTNNTSCVAGMKGPTVVYTPDGVTRALFEEGLAAFPAPGKVVGPTSRW